MNTRAAIEYYRSGADDILYPCVVCASDTDDTPKPLILEVSPGGTNLEKGISIVEELACIAETAGKRYIVARPTGRGPGSVYQNYGEVDVLETIEHLASHYPVNRDRISVTGKSMGGAATWYLTSHYPDLFAAAAPVCGYCDYRLWEKPGGYTFHMHPWEEPSWKARSAAFIPENLIHTPLWITHGGLDRSVGGGVPVEHSRRMAARLVELGYAFTYTEVPGVGHGVSRPTEVIPWLLEQKKTRNPRRVALATYELRHNSSYWITIDQIQVYGERATVDATADKLKGIHVATENIQTLTLRPEPEIGNRAVVLDGQELGTHDRAGAATFLRSESGMWKRAEEALPGQKHHDSSGPISDLFHHGVVLVPGEAGSDDETFYNNLMAKNAAKYFMQRNGGVHRGGIMGETSVELPIVPDGKLSEELRTGSNLLLYGTYRSNAVLKSFDGRIPLEFTGDTIRICGKSFAAKNAAVIAVFPHPENPKRYVAVHGGTRPDSITWGSHLDMMLLPDYLLYAGGNVIDWGFWNNEWR